MYYKGSIFWSVMVTLKKNPICLEVLPNIFGSISSNLVPIEQKQVPDYRILWIITPKLLQVTFYFCSYTCELVSCCPKKN
jgi:hypothetical protein